MLKIKIERYLWFWEKKRFDAIIKLVENSKHKYVDKIRGEVEKILEGKYHVGEGGHHLWIHRKNSDKRLAIILETDL